MAQPHTLADAETLQCIAVRLKTLSRWIAGLGTKEPVRGQTWLIFLPEGWLQRRLAGVSMETQVVEFLSIRSQRGRE